MSNSLFDKYMLDQIKTEQDALRQVLAVDALLVGAYITVLSSILFKVAEYLQDQGLVWEVNFWEFFVVIFIVAVLFSPLGLWFDAMEKSLEEIGKNNLAEYPLISVSSEDLIHINAKNQKALERISYRTVFGLGVIGTFMLFAIGFVTCWALHT